MTNSQSSGLETDENLLKTIKGLPNQVFRYRLDEENNYVITFSEGRIAEEFGMTTDEVEGKTLEEVMGKEAASKYAKYYDRVFAGETVRFEAKHGGRWFFNVVSPLHPKSGKDNEEIVGYAVDVTQRKQAERRFSLAQQFAEVGTWEYDFADDTLFWNAECERLFGLEEGEFGETYQDFLSRVHPDDRGRVRKETDPDVLKGEKSEIKFEHRIIREDGETRWVREMAQKVTNTEGEVERIIGMVMDVTDQKDTHRELQESEKKYRKIFNNANDAMYLHGVEEGVPTEFMEVNEVATEMLGYSREELLSMSPRDIDADTGPERMSRIMEELAESDKKTFEVQHRKKDGSLVPVEISAHLFEMSGREVVLAIARDITERKKHQRELERATLETLHALNRTIEAKDEYTGSHIDRVQDFSVALGERLGLSDERLEQLEYASILHDVGKIGIDDSILGKPGPLTEEEWVEMEKHPKIGERIVGQVDRLEKAATIIGQHQEKYDGSGYPEGLRKEEISLEARIIAVVDAWDAMRTDRPYRDALTREEAKKELKENKSTQFDPEIVDLFLEMIEGERLEIG